MGKFQVAIECDVKDLWDAVWCSDGSGMTYWADMIRAPDMSGISLWDTADDYAPVPQDFMVHDSYENRWHLVTLSGLVDAFALSVKNGWVDYDLSDVDETFGDVVVQVAVFGDVVYG